MPKRKKRKSPVKKPVAKKRKINKPKSKGAVKMPAKKRRRKASAVKTVAKATRKIVRRVRASKRLRHSKGRSMGGSGLQSQKPTAMLLNVAIAGIAAIAGSMAANKIPVANTKVKAAIPLALGVGLGMSKLGRNPKGMAAALGLSIAGALALVNQFKPGLTTLAGDETVFLPNHLSGPTMLGISENLDGDLDGDLAGEELSGVPFVTSSSYSQF